MQAPVAITGAGCLCAAGMDLRSAFAAMLQGERQPQPPQLFSTSHEEVSPVFEIYQPLPAPETDLTLLRTTRLAISATLEALADAGLSAELLRGLKVGVCIGTTVGSAMNNEDFYREYQAGKDPDMAQIDRYLRSNPATAIARLLQLDGPCQVVVNACSSGTDAIGLAAGWIRQGLCDVVITGGADELCRTTYNGFSSLRITSPQPCRPFDVNRRGLNLGEGSGVLILENRASLQRRGKRPRAFVRGYGSASDAYHLTAPHPDGIGLKQAINEALAGAGIAAQELAFVNAHGTGTPDNDRVESRVLAELMPGIHFGSTKCFTGHTLGAAGGIEAALTLCCLEQGRMPANVGFSEPDPQLPATPVTSVTSLTKRIALSQSLAFGGNNAALIIALEER